MSDNPQPDRPAGESPNEGVSEEGVDGALQNTADLASDLSSELGAEPPPSAETAPSGAGAGADNREGIDDQLEEIDALLGQVGDELGDAPEDDSEGSNDDGSSAAEADEAGASPSAASLDSAIDNEMESWDESFDDADLPDFDDAAEAEADSESRLPVAGSESEGDDSTDTESGGDVRRSPGLLGRAVALLEVIDRPFGFVSYRLRRIIGWVALATLFAAVCVFLFS